ncbi:hypothetical protein D5086_008434 [Populus alba]|uniref:Uncharacterized protein n=1 Tax=Populus alba TaxID=43335 RepID=A0ACC4CGR5_POPAL
MASAVLVKEAICSQDSSNGLELRSATPDERSDGRSRKWNQRALLQIKDLLASESWKEAQLVLRRCSSNLKLDLDAVIQSKPGKERSQLRTLFQSLQQSTICSKGKGCFPCKPYKPADISSTGTFHSSRSSLILVSPVK